MFINCVSDEIIASQLHYAIENNFVTINQVLSQCNSLLERLQINENIKLDFLIRVVSMYQPQQEYPSWFGKVRHDVTLAADKYHQLKQVAVCPGTIVSALGKLLKMGLVHGDIKSANFIMLGGEPYLIDLGTMQEKGNLIFESLTN